MKTRGESGDVLAASNCERVTIRLAEYQPGTNGVRAAPQRCLLACAAHQEWRMVVGGYRQQTQSAWFISYGGIERQHPAPKKPVYGVAMTQQARIA